MSTSSPPAVPHFLKVNHSTAASSIDGEAIVQDGTIPSIGNIRIYECRAVTVRRLLPRLPQAPWRRKRGSFPCSDPATRLRGQTPWRRRESRWKETKWSLPVPATFFQSNSCHNRSLRTEHRTTSRVPRLPLSPMEARRPAHTRVLGSHPVRVSRRSSPIQEGQFLGSRAHWGSRLAIRCCLGSVEHISAEPRP
jgi:hypothetical protein